MIDSESQNITVKIRQCRLNYSSETIIFIIINFKTETESGNIFIDEVIKENNCSILKKISKNYAIKVISSSNNFKFHRDFPDGPPNYSDSIELITDCLVTVPSSCLINSIKAYIKYIEKELKGEGRGMTWTACWKDREYRPARIIESINSNVNSLVLLNYESL